MKTISQFLGVALIASAFLCSCAKIENTPQREPSPVVDDLMTSAFFATKGDANMTIDPGAGKPYQIPVALDKPAEQEMSVKLIVKQNTGDVFTVPETITFGAGEQTANLEITYDGSKTEKAKIYTLEIAIDGNAYNPYKQFDGATAYLGTFLFEKWNVIGTGVYVDPFEGIQNNNMSLYQLDGENLYELREWPYKPLFEGYLVKYGGDWADYEAEMKESSAEKIRFSLYQQQGDSTYYVKFNTYNLEYYQAPSLIQAFYPTDFSASLAPYLPYSKLLNEGNKIQFAPYMGVSGVGGWGAYLLSFTLDNNVTIPVK